MSENYNSKDRLFITDIIVSENPNVNTLYCDSKGILSMGSVDNSLKETINQILASNQGSGKYCAIASIEIDNGQSLTLGTEINYQEALALPEIRDMALSGKTVDGVIPERYILSVNKMINKAKIKAIEQGCTPKVPASKLEEEFDPSLHLIILDPKDKTPIWFFNKEDKDATAICLTDNGRISYLPISVETVRSFGEREIITVPLIRSIKERIELRYPNERDSLGIKVKQYLAAGVYYKNQEQVGGMFIYEVHGFREPFPEIDAFYKKLNSLLGSNVGDKNYSAVEQYFTNEPNKAWVNELIGFLKLELDWKNYVKGTIDSIRSSKP